MYALALKNLLTDVKRVLITQAGVSFAVVLILIQTGIFFGIMANSSTVIDHSAADIWIASKNSPNLDFGRPIPERYLHAVRSTPGVQRAETLMLGWGSIRRRDGSSEKIEVIGYHPDAGPGWGEPWGLIEGTPRSVLGGRYMIVDRSSEKRLGPIHIGERFEIDRTDYIVRGVTSGIRTITSSPYVFVNYDDARGLIEGAMDRDTVFILAKVLPGADPAQVKAALQKKLPYVDVMSREEYSDRTRYYWSIKTGMGLSFILSAVLSLLVGVSIVGQVVYSDTSDRQREYAVLRALGASSPEVIGLLGLQATATSIIGYILGGALALGIQHVFDVLYLTVALPSWLWAFVACVTFLMCIGGSLTSVQKVMRLDPGMVFSGP